MPRIDDAEFKIEPTPDAIVTLLKRIHDCSEQRFDGVERRLDEAAAERAATTEQVTVDRHASKNRDMVLDGGLKLLKDDGDETRKLLGAVSKRQVAVRGQITKLVSGQVALNGNMAAAAAKADTAATKADAAATAAAAVGEKVQGITEALGLAGNKAKPVALWSPRKVLVAVATGGTTLFFFAKIADALWPFMVGFAHGFPGIAWSIVKALWRVATA